MIVCWETGYVAHTIFLVLLLQSILQLNVIICFRYEVFTGRILLAALDHKFYVFRKSLEGQFKKIYSKRSGNWRVEPVKEPKQYPHLALLQTNILQRRAEDKDPIIRHTEVSPSNPIHLAPAIAMKRGPFN